MREGGVEPPRPFGHTDLNRARLPIPPLAREARTGYPSARGDQPQTRRGAQRAGPSGEPPRIQSRRSATARQRHACMSTTDEEGGDAWAGCRTVRAAAGADDLRRVRPRLPLARCSRSRSRPRCSASATTTRRSSPATGGWCPTTSTSSCRASDLERLAPYDTALADELSDQLQDHADAQGYVFPGPIAHRVRAGRRPHHRAVPDPQPRPGPGAAATPPTPRYAGRGRCSRSTAPSTRCSRPGLVVGRGTEADVRINDPGVSRRHIEFQSTQPGGERQDLRIEVRDLGSTNGMLVDGHKVTKAGLRDGSEVKIGNTTMTVRIVEDVATAEGGPVSELTLFLIRHRLPGDPVDLRAVGDLGDPLRHVRRPGARGARAARRAARGRKRRPRRRRSAAARPTHVAGRRGQQRRRSAPSSTRRRS